MPDRLFFPLIALTAVVVIAVALVWPQGLGRRSPAPFGHDTAAMSATPSLRPAVTIHTGAPPPGASHP